MPLLSQSGTLPLKLFADRFKSMPRGTATTTQPRCTRGPLPFYATDIEQVVLTQLVSYRKFSFALPTTLL